MQISRPSTWLAGSRLHTTLSYDRRYDDRSGRQDRVVVVHRSDGCHRVDHCVWPRDRVRPRRVETHSGSGSPRPLWCHSSLPNSTQRHQHTLLSIMSDQPKNLPDGLEPATKMSVHNARRRGQTRTANGHSLSVELEQALIRACRILTLNVCLPMLASWSLRVCASLAFSLVQRWRCARAGPQR
jgi:hypothetical protein